MLYQGIGVAQRLGFQTEVAGPNVEDEGLIGVPSRLQDCAGLDGGYRRDLWKRPDRGQSDASFERLQKKVNRGSVWDSCDAE
jgi:hypothetical protein